MNCPWPATAERFHRGALYHRGDLRQPARPAHGPSLEGPCLSCAPDLETSEAWRRIARLGGLPLWTLGRTEGFRLVNARKVPRRRLAKAALDMGMVQPTEVFRVTWFDDEMGGEVYSEHLTRAEAEAEMDEDHELKVHTGYVATPDLIAYWHERSGEGRRAISPALVLDAALVAIADRHFPHLDGVLWMDRLDVAALSAPRVGLFQRTIRSLTIRLES